MENQSASKKLWSNPELKVLSKDIIQSGPNTAILELEVGDIINVTIGGGIPS